MGNSIYLGGGIKSAFCGGNVKEIWQGSNKLFSTAPSDDAIFNFLSINGDKNSCEPNYGLRKDDYKQFLQDGTTPDGKTFKYINTDILRNGVDINTWSVNTGIGWDSSSQLIQKLRNINAFTIEFYAWIDSSSGAGGYASQPFRVEYSNGAILIESTLVHARYKSWGYRSTSSSSYALLSDIAYSGMRPFYETWNHVSMCIEKSETDLTKSICTTYYNGSYRTSTTGSNFPISTLASMADKFGIPARNNKISSSVAPIRIVDIKIYDYKKRTDYFTPNPIW